ncbi:P-loop NTPase fold protein [Campylobacter coli]|uniref:P-loop NTPase fold protein n=1 Tax=Campylobacter coli TaxID=195 RepID=UPI003D2FA7CC
MKNEINTALLNIDIKIIVVIDDLDRLADTDIQEIFQYDCRSSCFSGNVSSFKYY